MNSESFERTPSALSAAIRAVERQKQVAPSLLDADARAQRSAVFHFLDAAQNEIFSLIAAAAERGQRQMRLTDVPLLAQRFPSIFYGSVEYEFDAVIVNDWLFAKDLSHHFYADGVCVRW